MLLYNYQKEFLGIDEKDLKILGFTTLAELKAEVSDFADLFIKTPGYVHNFKHVHWIDFIAYADEGEVAKVLINVNAKTFTAKLTLEKAYLADNPSSPAFIIHLNGLRSLSQTETDSLSSGLLDRELPDVTPHEPTTIIPTQDASQTAAVSEEHYNNITTQEPLENIATPVTQTTIPDTSDDIDSMLDVGDLSIDVDESLFSEEEAPKEEPVKTELSTTPEHKQQAPKPSKPQQKHTSAALKLANTGFVYDPSIASKELGLPLDLIEEFIEDFITQANDFKPKIYSSLEDGDIDNVKILAHKLKGVAANLRVEDAHEVLSNISASSDAAVIRENMDAFYIIMKKLAGEEIPELSSSNETSTTSETTLELADDNDTLELSFKDEEPETIQTPQEISDEDVPLQIDIPELADDDFYQQDLIQEEALEENNDDLIEIPELSEELSKENEQEDITLSYSKSQVAQEIGLSLEDFNELFADFEHESQEILQNIKSAATQEDFESVKAEALKLKGMSDNMRLQEFTQALTDIIQVEDTSTVIQTVELLEKQLKQISAMGV